MDTLLREPEESEVSIRQKQKRQKFNKEFKADAVSLVIEQGYSAANVGKRLGIHQRLSLQKSRVKNRLYPAANEGLPSHPLMQGVERSRMRGRKNKLKNE